MEYFEGWDMFIIIFYMHQFWANGNATIKDPNMTTPLSELGSTC
jgi:hypothetical protein